LAVDYWDGKCPWLCFQNFHFKWLVIHHWFWQGTHSVKLYRCAIFFAVMFFYNRVCSQRLSQMCYPFAILHDNKSWDKTSSLIHCIGLRVQGNTTGLRRDAWKRAWTLAVRLVVSKMISQKKWPELELRSIIPHKTTFGTKSCSIEEWWWIS
jgi:hypothetical protein